MAQHEPSQGELKLKSIGARLRNFDYFNLSFLQTVSLVAVVLLFTAFRAAQMFESQKVSTAFANFQSLDQVEDIASEVLAGVALVEDHDAKTYSASARQLVQLYENLLNRRSMLNARREFQLGCSIRLCGALFDPHVLSFSPTQLERILFATNLPNEEREAQLGQFSRSIARYYDALKDGVVVLFDQVKAQRRTTIMLDIVAYFALLSVLVLQTLYVFRPALRRLNESLATRSDFLSRISHEIRNPMNSILGMADILKGTRLNFEQQQYVNNLLRSGHALLDMLDNLIDFSVIENGRLRLQSHPFDLFHSLDRCLSLVAIQAHHKELNLYLTVDPRVPQSLIGDRTRLDQVLINLLNNAVKFTQQGYIGLQVERLDQTEDVTKDGEVTLKFTVSDSGIGIKEEQLEEIFESFVQADSSIRRKYGGAGLGLAISRQILRQMNSQLYVQSEFGRGANFFFTLKLKPQLDESLKTSRPLLQLTGRRLIFLVDHNAASHYQRTMDQLGYISHILHSARELRNLLSEPSTRDVSEVLIDDSIGIISMINCRNLTEEFGLQNQSVALIRSNFAKENMDLLKRNGFTRFLFKPLKPWELIALPSQMREEPYRPASVTTPEFLVSKLREKNLRALLVDDSNDNLFLLKEVVNPVVASVHFAENGLEAIEKFRANTYDVVFMDIQMPVMDGYTAIRKMRQMEGGVRNNSPIPIYAVTAHAGLVDAQKCREAGFTDRVVKPVARNEIYKSLSRAFDLDVVEADEAQDDGLIPAKYLAKLMPIYFKTRFEDLAKLRDALAKDDFSSIKALGHKIKGSAASYGFVEVSELSLKLERAADKSDAKICVNLVNELEDRLRTEQSRNLNA